MTIESIKVLGLLVISDGPRKGKRQIIGSGYLIQKLSERLESLHCRVSVAKNQAQGPNLMVAELQ